MILLEALPYAAIIMALLGVIVLHYRSVQTGKLVPRATVDLMVKHYDDRYDDIVAAHAVRIAAKDVELDKVWAAYHLEAESKNQLVTTDRDQATATTNAAVALMEALQRARNQLPEAASGSPGA